MAQEDPRITQLVSSLETLLARVASSSLTSNKEISMQLQPFNEKDETFSSYVQQLENYFKLKEVASKKKVTVLLNCLSPKLYELLQKLTLPVKPVEKTYDELIQILKKHLEPKPNEVAECYKFSLCVQKEEETISDFISNLKALSAHCNFNCLHCKKNISDDHMRTQFICGLRDASIRERLLQEELSFERAVTLAVNLEMSKKNSIHMNTTNKDITSVHAVQVKDDVKSQQCTKCGRCGYKNHKTIDCHFKNATCNKCQKVGHLASVCKSLTTNQPKEEKSQYSQSSRCDKNEKKYQKSDKKTTSSNVDQVLESDTESDEYKEDVDLYQVSADSTSDDKLFIKVLVNNILIKMEVDTGTRATVISKKNFHNFFGDVKLEDPDCSFKTALKHKFRPIGYYLANVKYGNVSAEGKLYVVDGDIDSLIGRTWLRALKLLKGDSLIINQVSETSDVNAELNELLEKYSTLFDGKLGKAKNVIASLLVKPGAKPIYQKPATVPFALKSGIGDKIEEFEKLGVYEKTKNSSWGTPIVPVFNKNNKLRLCGNYKITINKHLVDDKYPIPTIDDIFSKLNGGKYFCKLDIQNAYMHIPMDEESAKLQTIVTHLGCYKVNHLMFGVKNAPSIWQRYMDQLLHSLEGVSCFFNDIKIQGSTEEELLASLEKVLSILYENGLKLNKTKCEFFKKSIHYLGYKIDASGIHKTHDKIKAILKAKQPQNITELRSLLGLINHYNRFIPNLATIVKPLNRRLRKSEQFKWTKNCQKSFELVKEEITSDRVLVPFNPNLPLLLATDASSYGLGAVLSHRFPDESEKPIMFASKTLTPTEEKYSQIDKEALAIYWALNKFFIYCFGHTFTLITYHKPLTRIFHPEKSLPTLATSRMLHYALFLSGFNFNIEYRESKKNGNADFVSRFPLPAKISDDDSDIHLIMHIETLENFPITVNEIRRETRKDAELATLFNSLQKGDNLVNSPYQHLNGELGIENGCIIRGIRTLIPKKLQSTILDELHFGHFGICKMKELA